MINKVVYIGYQPLTVKVKEDFYFQNLIDKGIEVAYWDLTNIYFPNILKDQLQDYFIVKMNSFSKLEESLKLLDKERTLFITNITFEFRVLKLYKILSKYNCKTSFFARGALPSFSGESKWRSIVSKLRKATNFNLLFRYSRNKYAYLLKKKGKAASFFIVFRAGKLGIQTIGVGNGIEEKTARIIDVNSFDFDKYIEVKGNNRIIDQKYCLYLDEYFPFHPDFKMLKINTVEPSEFYKGLNSFFEFIENKFNLEVVIAAHPKAEKYQEQNFFNNRKVFFHKTAELTRDSDFVIAHCSTSISFAVLNNKPILSLTTAAIKNEMRTYHNFITSFSKILGTYLINVDENELDSLKVLPLDIVKYSEYKYNYLTSQMSETQISSEIFIKTIQKL